MTIMDILMDTLMAIPMDTHTTTDIRNCNRNIVTVKKTNVIIRMITSKPFVVVILQIK